MMHVLIIVASLAARVAAVNGDEVACLTGPELAGLIFGCIFGTVVIVSSVAAALFYFKRWLNRRNPKETLSENGGLNSLHSTKADSLEPKLPAKQGCGSAHCCRKQNKPQPTVLNETTASQTGSPIKKPSVQDQPERWRRSAGSLTTTIQERVRVPLKSQDFAGLGFTICGNMRDGIFVKEILSRGPAKDCGKLKPGDRIVNLKVCFENIVFEDALTILSYASPYEVEVELLKSLDTKASRVARRSDLGLGTEKQLRRPQFHPLVRSQSLEEALNAYQIAAGICHSDQDRRRSKSYAVGELSLQQRMGAKRDSTDSSTVGGNCRMSLSAFELIEEDGCEESADLNDCGNTSADEANLNEHADNFKVKQQKTTMLKHCDLAAVPLSEASDAKQERPVMVLAEVIVERGLAQNDGDKKVLQESSRLAELQSTRPAANESVARMVVQPQSCADASYRKTDDTHKSRVDENQQNQPTAPSVDKASSPSETEATSDENTTSIDDSSCLQSFSTSTIENSNALNTSLSLSSYDEIDELNSDECSLELTQRKLNAHQELLNQVDDLANIPASLASLADSNKNGGCPQVDREGSLKKTQKDPPPVAPKKSHVTFDNQTRTVVTSKLPTKAGFTQKIVDQSGKQNDEEEITYKINPNQIRKVTVDSKPQRFGTAAPASHANLRSHASKSPTPLSRQSSASSGVSLPTKSRNQDLSDHKPLDNSSSLSNSMSEQKDRLFKKASATTALSRPTPYRKTSSGSMQNSVESLNSLPTKTSQNGGSLLVGPRNRRENEFKATILPPASSTTASSEAKVHTSQSAARKPTSIGQPFRAQQAVVVGALGSQQPAKVSQNGTAVGAASLPRPAGAEGTAGNDIGSIDKSTSNRAMQKRDSGYGTMNSGAPKTSIDGVRPNGTNGNHIRPLDASAGARKNIDAQQYQKLMYYQQQLAKQHEELKQLGVQVPSIQTSGVEAMKPTAQQIAPNA